MTIEFAFSSPCDASKAWVWFPGWGFDAEVFTELAQGLPGQHYWYRWQDALTFEQAVDDVCQHIPEHAILVGWSLGGALAAAIAHRQPAPAALITMATPPKFCRAPQWPYGMPRGRFENFVATFIDNPRKTQMTFLALNAQGIDKPKNVIRILARQQRQPTEALQRQLAWLDQFDFTAVDMANCLCLHLFADNDALVAPPNSHGQWRYEFIADACYAFFIHNPELLTQQLLSLYSQLDEEHEYANVE